jgi:hypothetical protein
MNWNIWIVAMLPVTGVLAGEFGYTDTPLLPGSKWRVHDKDRPEPAKVQPGAPCFSAPPSDAIVLFDGKDLSQWSGVKVAAIEDRSFDIMKTGEIETRQQFGDCQLHVEWLIPAQPDGDWAVWGNSGVFPLGLYELQIIETYTRQIYADGIAGAIYGQTPPLVNAARPPGEWQSFDITFTAPRFDPDGKLLQPAYFTVYWNGVLVQNHQASLGPVKHREVADYTNKTTRGPIKLQNHGSHVRFRNLWVRTLGT